MKLIKSKQCKEIEAAIWSYRAKGKTSKRGKYKGRFRTDGHGMTIRWATIMKLKDGSEVIYSPDNIKDIDLTEFTYTIITKNPDLFPDNDTN